VIAHFLDLVEESNLQNVTERALRNSEASGEPDFFYEDQEGRIEFYRNEPGIEDIVHPFRNNLAYIIGIKPSYKEDNSFFGMYEPDAEKLGKSLYERVHSTDDAYMKIMSDLDNL